jgi:DNA polymerase III epsilon subunit-like protein
MYDPTKVAYVDCETLGLNPDVHPIWEIAIILPDRDEEHVWQVRPTAVEISNADPIAVTISGFGSRYDDAAAFRSGETVDRFSALLEGRHIVGAVPSFDEERLRRMYLDVYPTPDRFPWHYRLVCVEALAVGFIACGSREYHSVNEVGLPWDSHRLGEILGVDPTPEAERHTALGDARWARRMYEAICGE